MSALLKNKFENVHLFFYSKNYREFLRLLTKYGRKNRKQNREIKFLDYNIVVNDCLAFIFQYKEIFVKEYYLFETTNPTPVIYDCGANIGVSALFFKERFPNAKVFAFEPDPEIAELLINNLKHNSVSGVNVYSKAVWINNEGVEFGVQGSDSGSIYSQKDKIRVDTLRLKEMLDKEGRVDFLKLDVEGAETEIIKDCGGSLKKVENLFVEYHSFLGRKQELDEILKVLTENGFIYYIKSERNYNSPFVSFKKNIDSDINLQLNIFAVREH